MASEIVKIELDKLALLLQEKDELEEANALLKRALNNKVLDSEIGVNNIYKELKEENASLKQELKKEKEKLEKYYKQFCNMESLYLETIAKHKDNDTKLSKVEIPISTINTDVLKDTLKYIKTLDVTV